MAHQYRRLSVAGHYQAPLEITAHAILRCAQRFIKEEIPVDGVCRDSSLGRRCLRLLRRLIKDSTQKIPASDHPGGHYVYCGTKCLVLQGQIVVTVYVHRRHRPGIEELDRLLQAS